MFELRSSCPRAERAQWIYERLVRFKYQTLPKKDKGIVLRYIQQITGLTEKQIDRHVAAYKGGGKLCTSYRRRCFLTRYTKEDVELLAEVDNATRRLSGNLTAQFCANQYAAGDGRFVRLKDISSAQLYRLRQSRRYREEALVQAQTRSVDRPIGERTKPRPGNHPGFLRVDTVHQGDLNGEKGVYHVNLVSEVTQWEVLLAVEEISETFLEPLLEEAVTLFPFFIKNFHSDCGGEYINYTVAGLLEKLRIRQTKSRPRRSTDNGLVESKNAAVVRKEMGHWHIPGVFAPRINLFYKDHLLPYLNFHRPCHFPEKTALKNGKVIVKYRRKDCQTPYQKLLSLPEWEQYLRPGITAETLAQQAKAKTPLQAAQEKNRAREKLFSVILKKLSATLPSSMTE
jgi:hypothetical protein